MSQRELNRLRVVHLVRHGEVWNPDRVLYGRMNGFHLSPRGEEQAWAAARFLAARDIGYLVSSPLERARQTASPLGELLGLPTHVDARLIEAENKLEGRPVAGGKGLLTDPRIWPQLINPLRPSWGEPYREIAQRVLAATRAARDAAGDTAEAVCVSHQLPIVAARRYVEGKRLAHDPRRRQCALASVTSFTFVGDVVVRVDYAEPAGATPAGSVAGA
jgi:broad specificity phosphatase PhoE